jgi:hypothetical protein
MTQRQLHKLPNLRHLFAAPTNVVISDIRQVCLFVFSLDGITIYLKSMYDYIVAIPKTYRCESLYLEPLYRTQMDLS